MLQKRLDGKKMAEQMMLAQKDQLAARDPHLKIPKLVVVLLGDNPASQVYVGRKLEMAQSIGIQSEVVHKPTSLSQEGLEAIISQLNQDTEVNAILVQLPLPSHINTSQILEKIAPQKDVDAFHPANLGRLLQNRPLFIPPTPHACMKIICSVCKPSGKKVVILGRSLIVGKPLAALLTNLNATVTLAHSKSKNLQELCLDAEIIVVAIGIPHFLRADMVAEGAIVIDVGINQIMLDGKKRLVGDVDYQQVAAKASHITPVPGGVGPMTVACLMENTLRAASLNQAQ